MTRPGTISHAVVRTEGQRMLLAVTGTLAAIANEIGAKTPTVHAWKVGAKLPNIQARARMQEAFGIPARAWSIRPGGALVTDPEAPPPETLINGASPSTLEDCLALLSVIRRDRTQQGLMPSERVKLADSEARILALRARLEEAEKFAEAKYVTEHPAWLRLKRTILRALEQHPAAARAVADAIANMDTLPS